MNKYMYLSHDACSSYAKGIAYFCNKHLRGIRFPTHLLKCPKYYLLNHCTERTVNLSAYIKISMVVICMYLGV